MELMCMEFGMSQLASQTKTFIIPLKISVAMHQPHFKIQ